MSITLRLVLAAVIPACVLSDDLSTLRSQLTGLLLPDASDQFSVSAMARVDVEVPAQVAALNSSGLWPDINYFDQDDRSEWAAATHLQRCLMIGTAYVSNVSVHHGQSQLLQACNACTAGWLAADPQNTNWWWQQFGVLQIMSKLLLLCPNATTLAGVNDVLYPRLTIPEVVGFPGANRVWASLIHVMIGVLNNNASHVDLAYSLMQASYAPVDPLTPGDGIQVDRAFHQHGPLAYFSYGYGAHFVANALTMEGAALGTRWVMNSTQWSALSAYLLDGARWGITGSEYHLGAMGRHNTYYQSSDQYGVTNGHYHFYAAYPHFALAFPDWSGPFNSSLANFYARLLPPFVRAQYPRAADMQALYQQVIGAQGNAPSAPAVVGHKRFWRTDYSIHARPGASYSLHTFSNRTLNTECANSEGTQNRGVADGALTTYVTGREYTNHVPVWRWSLIPGATQLQTSEPFTCGNAQITDTNQRLSFVGGATDGWDGVACMDLARIDDNSLLRARKAWFFQGGTAVSLGAGIQSDGKHNVVTTFDQRPLNGSVWYGTTAAPTQPVQAGDNGLVERPDVAWVLHSGLLYGQVVPATGNGSQYGVSTRTQVGSWGAITQGPNTTITIPTFLSYAHHGPADNNAVGTYGYAILPVGPETAPADAAAAWQAFASTVTVVSNTPQLQAVCFSAPNASVSWMVQAVAWPAYNVSSAGHGVATSRATTTEKTQTEAWQLQATGACPSVSVSVESLVLVSLGTDGTLRVTASSPEIERRLASVTVTVAGVTATGPACAPAPGGGTAVTVQLPVDPATVGSSSTVLCTA